MLNVPQLKENRVEERAVGDLRGPAPSSASRAVDVEGVGKIGQGLDRLAGAYVKRKAQEKDNADKMVVEEAVAKALKTKRYLQFDREGGYTNRRGKNAFGANEEFSQLYNENLMSIRDKDLYNDNQKELFRSWGLKDFAEFQNSAMKHEQSEIFSYDKDVFKNSQISLREDAIGNYGVTVPTENGPRSKIDESIGQQHTLIDTFAQRNGMSADWVKVAKLNAESTTRRQVIERMVSDEKEDLALETYDKIKNKLSDDDRKDLKQFLDNVGMITFSQRFVDKIYADKLSDQDAVKRIESKLSGKKRAEAKKHYWARRQEDKMLSQMAEDESFQTQYDYLTKGETKVKLPGGQEVVKPMARHDALAQLKKKPAFWELSAKNQTYLENAAKKDPGSDMHDWDMWLNFIDMPREKVRSMSQGEFRVYHDQFDKPHKHRAELIWKGSKQGEEGAIKVTQFRNANKLIQDKAQEFGVIPKGKSYSKLTQKQKKKYQTFYSNIQDAIWEKELNENGGKPLNAQQRDEVMDKMLLNKVFVDDNWLLERDFEDDKQVPVLLLKDKQRKNAWIPKAKIPTDQWAFIQRKAEELGAPYNKKNFEDYYTALVLGSPVSEAEKILFRKDD